MTDASELINTRAPAPRVAEMLLASRQAQDYFNVCPYPQWAFSAAQWPLKKGPTPTALPLAKTLVSEGAEFLFRNGAPTLSVPEDPDADELLQEIIAQNSLSARWIPLAENAANQGALAAKFSVDLDDAECPVRITFLDIPQECRVWIDPHDAKRILMARVQYPYRDLADGRWYYYREEWTDEEFVTYEPRPAGDGNCQGPGDLPGYFDHLGDGAEGEPAWVIATREENPFGVIPITVIRNRAVEGNPLGEGDCWQVFRLIDRLALTMHGEDRSNQQHSDPKLVVTNATLLNEGEVLPGEPIEVDNKDPDKDADVKLLEPSGAAREYSHKSMDRWEDYLYAAVGLSRVNPESVTNKGSMTIQAFMMTYQRTIATSDRKRELWGSALCRFFKTLLIGLRNLGGIARVQALPAWPEAPTVSISWPPYFAPSEPDKATVTDRTEQQVNAGMLTPERGVERVARAEGMPDGEIAKLLTELKAHRQKVRRLQIADEQRRAKLGAAAAGVDRSELADLSLASGMNNFTT